MEQGFFSTTTRMKFKMKVYDATTSLFTHGAKVFIASKIQLHEMCSEAGWSGKEGVKFYLNGVVHAVNEWNDFAFSLQNVILGKNITHEFEYFMR